MTEWKLMKNTMAEEPCWQLYYETTEGKRRYLDVALSYPQAKALIAAIADPVVHGYLVAEREVEPTSLYQYRQEHKTEWHAYIAKCEEIESCRRLRQHDTYLDAGRWIMMAITAEEA